MTDRPDLAQPAQADPQPIPVRPVPMEQRTVIVLISGFGAVLLASLMMMLPVPYILLKPGPVLNTLGQADGKPLISISGHSSYPARGELDLTTVSEVGGADRSPGLLAALQAWISRSDAVVPRDAVIPKGQTSKQTDEQNRSMMTSSQESATAAALAALKIKVPAKLVVADIEPGAAAGVALKPKDVITAVNGVRVPDLETLSAQLGKVRAGDRVKVTVDRDGRSTTVETLTGRGDTGRALLRIFIDPRFSFPFQVRIQIGNIGGPSAGTMFALGIIDLLTPGDLTGGKLIAGTGTMDISGTVGPISGIQQKMAGARRAGARYFLAPSENCDEVRGHIPDGLTVVRIATLDGAQAAVKAIAAGSAADLPGC